MPRARLRDLTLLFVFRRLIKQNILVNVSVRLCSVVKDSLLEREQHLAPTALSLLQAWELRGLILPPLTPKMTRVEIQSWSEDQALYFLCIETMFN